MKGNNVEAYEPARPLSRPNMVGGGNANMVGGGKGGGGYNRKEGAAGFGAATDATANASRSHGANGGGNMQGAGSQRRGRAQQAKKRATFPLINSKIIVAAETGDLMLLVSTIEANLQQMNLVNLSTAFHRIAKLCAGDPAAQAALRQHILMPNMIVAVHAALERAEANGAPPQCQAISNITWALATVQMIDDALLTFVADIARRHIDSFKPFELSATLWAYAKFRGIDPSVCDRAAMLFVAASDHIQTHIADFSFRCLIMVAFAYAASGHLNEALFGRLGVQIVASQQSASCQEVEQIVWAFGSAVPATGRHERLFADFARKANPRCSEFKPQELCSLMWSFAVAGYCADDFFDNAVTSLKFLDLQAQQLATLVASLACIRPNHLQSQATLLAVLPKCTRQIESFKPAELVAVAWASAKVFGEQSGSEEPLPQGVTDFFSAAQPWILTRMYEFPGRLLALLLASFLALRLGRSTELFPALGCAVLRQSQVLDTPSLMLLLRCLPAVPQNACTGAACVLFTEVARRLELLHARELQELSQICSRFLDLGRNALSREELQSCCSILTQAGPMAVAQTKASVDDIRHVLAAGPPFLQQQAGLPLQPIPRVLASPAAMAASAANGPLPPGNVPAAPGPVGSDLRMGAWQAPAHSQHAGSVPPGGAPGLPPGVGALDKKIPISIKNTFIDIGGEPDDAEESPSKLLPPPLDIIPPDVSGEKLAAYRMDYQNFRAGKPVGAKGEVSDKVALELDLAVSGLDLAVSPEALSQAGQGAPGLFVADKSADFGCRGRQWMPADASMADLPATGPELSSWAEPASAGSIMASPPKDLNNKGEVPAFSVKNTFITINDGDDIQGDSDDDEPTRVLPPPLPFISEVSEEKLEAYRHAYQDFRAGKSHGAKGEVASSVALDEVRSSVALDLAVDDEVMRSAQRQQEEQQANTKDESGSGLDNKPKKGGKKKTTDDLRSGQPAFVQLSGPSTQPSAWGR